MPATAGDTMSDCPGDQRRPQDLRRLSAILRHLGDASTVERITLGDLIAQMGDRAFGTLIFLFALPNTFPFSPPGLTSILGAPLLLFAFQLVIGHTRPWVPRWLAGRSVTKADFLRFIDRAMPWLERAERVLRPRWRPLIRPGGERIVGILCLMLALVIVLPIPLGNILPALAVSVLALGLIEEDGVAIALGGVLALVSLAVVGAVLLAIFQAIVFFLDRAFS